MDLKNDPHQTDQPKDTPPETGAHPDVLTKEQDAGSKISSEKTADRPHKLTMVLTIISLVLSAGAVITSCLAFKINRENFWISHQGVVIRSLTVERVTDGNGDTSLVFSFVYSNPSDFAVWNLKATGGVLIRSKEKYRLPESVSAPDFSGGIIQKQQTGFTVVVHPSESGLAQADQGVIPVQIDGSVKYSNSRGDFGYSWDECYFFKKILPCPAK